MEELKLIKDIKQWLFVLSTFLIILLINLLFEYSKYQNLKESLVYSTDATILNIYEKESYKVYKLESDDFSFFTSVNKNYEYKKLDIVNISFLTQKISFYSYLRGFYTKSFGINFIESNSLKQELNEYISSQHENKDISEIYSAIFLAVPLNSDLRDTFSIYSISHLIAISGFHLAVLSSVLYFLIYYPYSYFHKRFFPFRNIRFDVLIFSFAILFLYVLFTNLVPSLLRAFCMMVFAFYLLRCNLKLISFETLFLVFLFVIAFFPSFLFSLSFWFSITGVFYIFLFIKYFKEYNKIVMILFFNFWIFFAFNPIVHYFFGVTSWIQLLSPFITILFTAFYPMELFLHLINYGSLLDNFLIDFISFKYETKDIVTPTWFFILYVGVSLLSIWYKRVFYLLNILIIGFNAYLYF